MHLDQMATTPLLPHAGGRPAWLVPHLIPEPNASERHVAAAGKWLFHLVPCWKQEAQGSTAASRHTDHVAPAFKQALLPAPAVRWTGPIRRRAIDDFVNLFLRYTASRNAAQLAALLRWTHGHLGHIASRPPPQLHFVDRHGYLTQEASDQVYFLTHLLLVNTAYSVKFSRALPNFPLRVPLFAVLVDLLRQLNLCADRVLLANAEHAYELLTAVLSFTDIEVPQIAWTLFQRLLGLPPGAGAGVALMQQPATDLTYTVFHVHAVAATAVCQALRRLNCCEE